MPVRGEQLSFSLSCWRCSPRSHRERLALFFELIASYQHEPTVGGQLGERRVAIRVEAFRLRNVEAVAAFDLAADTQEHLGAAAVHVDAQRLVVARCWCVTPARDVQ